MMSFEELDALVIDWARDKGILEKATPIAQAVKTGEEYNEMLLAIVQENRDELIDSIGDQVVTLIIQCEMNGLKLVNCLETAYKVIANRQGKMVGGQFVKDA